MAMGDQFTTAAIWAPVSGPQTVLMRRGTEALPAPQAVSEATTVYVNGEVETRIPIRLHGRTAGQLVLRASDNDINAKLIRNCEAALLLVLMSTTLAGGVAYLLARGVLKPLRALDRGMAAVQADGGFRHRLDITGEDELGRLGERFNRLLGHLEAADDRQQRMLAELTAAKNAAEDANVMKSQFLANMSHEIRTPLNGVLAMAQVMAMKPLSKTQRGHLQVIRDSGESLLAVLNDLLDLSKIEAGRLELEFAPFDVEDTAAGARAAFTALANEKGLSFALDVRETARGLWEGDSARVRQILYNLISNALKFTEEGEVRVTVDAAGGPLVLTVSDTGIGIAPEVLPRLFEKFVQGDASITRRFGGTGLGLTICRQLAALMGGDVQIESELGAGTTFRVILPLRRLSDAPLRAPAKAAPAARETALGGLRVLAAEDNATNRLVLQTALHALGVAPELVADGKAAVEAWRRTGPDLILMDIQMPIMDGVTATQEIRALEASGGLPRTLIVALSANAMKHQVADYLDAGMDGHLAKPIQLDRLYAVLAAAAEARGASETPQPKQRRRRAQS